jgi:hypothetical protein
MVLFSVGGAHRYDIAPLWGWCIKLLSGYYVIYAGRKPGYSVVLCAML